MQALILIVIVLRPPKITKNPPDEANLSSGAAELKCQCRESHWFSHSLVSTYTVNVEVIVFHLPNPSGATHKARNPTSLNLVLWGNQHQNLTLSYLNVRPAYNWLFLNESDGKWAAPGLVTAEWNRNKVRHEVLEWISTSFLSIFLCQYVKQVVV